MRPVLASLDRISGPYGEPPYFVAAYVLSDGEASFVAYAKICRSSAADAWSCDAEWKVAGAAHATQLAALQDAERRAVQVIHGVAQIRSAADLYLVSDLYRLAVGRTLAPR
jgi:hypothetical protein